MWLLQRIVWSATVNSTFVLSWKTFIKTFRRNYEYEMEKPPLTDIYTYILTQDNVRCCGKMEK